MDTDAKLKKWRDRVKTEYLKIRSQNRAEHKNNVRTAWSQNK